MKSKLEIIKEYNSTCGEFTVECDVDDVQTYNIYTERFRASSLCARESQFSDFKPQIKNLFEVIFSDTQVMEKYATGAVKTEQEFQSLVELHSTRWSHNYRFAAFIVEDLVKDVVIGHEVIGNSGKPNSTGEVAYLFNKNYHRSDTTKNVGYENVGALIWGYGASLYAKKDCVNQVYDSKEEKFVGGFPFTSVSATSRIDNTASVRILEKLGFNKIDMTTKFGHDRYEFELKYEDFEDNQVKEDLLHRSGISLNTVGSLELEIE